MARRDPNRGRIEPVFDSPAGRGDELRVEPGDRVVVAPRREPKAATAAKDRAGHRRPATRRRHKSIPGTCGTAGAARRRRAGAQKARQRRGGAADFSALCAASSIGGWCWHLGGDSRRLRGRLLRHAASLHGKLGRSATPAQCAHRLGRRRARRQSRGWAGRRCASTRCRLGYRRR